MGEHLAGSVVEYVAVDLEVVSLSPTLGLEITLKRLLLNRIRDERNLLEASQTQKAWETRMGLRRVLDHDADPACMRGRREATGLVRGNLR